MNSRARIVSGLAVLAALFLAPIAEASLMRASNPAREVAALTLTLAAPESSEFSLFDGTEIARALASRPAFDLISITTDDAATAGRVRFVAPSELSTDELPNDAPELLPITSVREQPFNLRIPPDVFGLEPLRGPPGDEASYPKTRYRVFDFLGTTLVGVERGVSLELRWRSASFSCGLASGTVGWLSQDPMGDKDSPNLYGFVGARPHEMTDPLGLWGLKDAKRAASRVLREVLQASKNVGIGALDTLADTAELVLRFGDPQVQYELEQKARKIVRDAQDPALGNSPDNRLLNSAAIAVNEKKEEFLAADKDKQQQMIGGGAANVALALAPFAKGRVPLIAAEGEEAAMAGRSVGARARDPLSGPVEFEISPTWTPEQVAYARASVESFNRALQAGTISPSGRVSTKGLMRQQASRAATAERARAASAGQPYRGVAGHGPDTTWTGLPDPPEWLDTDRIVNSSLGAQARRYPVGYRPTEFILNESPAPKAP